MLSIRFEQELSLSEFNLRHSSLLIIDFHIISKLMYAITFQEKATGLCMQRCCCNEIAAARLQRLKGCYNKIAASLQKN